MERQRKTIESGRGAGPSMLLPAVVLAITFAFALGATLWFKPVSGGSDEPSASEQRATAQALRMEEGVSTPAVASAEQPVQESLRAPSDVGPTPTAQLFAPPPELPGEPAAVEPEVVVPEGRAGLVEALRRGELRPGSRADIDRWLAAARAAGQSIDPESLLNGHIEVFVILKDFTVPGGLHGANMALFVLEPGAPFPRGDLGHSLLLDVSSGGCVGATCRMMLSP